MTNEELINKMVQFVTNNPNNYVSEQDAIYTKLAGLKLYDVPIIGFALLHLRFLRDMKAEI